MNDSQQCIVTTPTCVKLMMVLVLVHSCIVMVMATVFELAIFHGYTSDTSAQQFIDRVAFNTSIEYANEFILGPLGHSIQPRYTPDNFDATLTMFRSIDAADYCNIGQEVWGIVGPSTSPSAVTASLVASGFNVPIVSYSATSSELSDKTLYPTFNRVIPADDAQVTSLANLCVYYGWSRVAMIFTNDVYGSKMALTFSTIADILGISIIYSSSFSPGKGSDSPTLSQVSDISEGLRLMKSNDARIILVFAYSYDAAFVFQQAAALDMAGAPYVYLGVDGIITTVEMPLGSLATQLTVSTVQPQYRAMKLRVQAVIPDLVVTDLHARQNDAILLFANALRRMVNYWSDDCMYNTTAPDPPGAPEGTCMILGSGTTSEQRWLLNSLVRGTLFTGAGGLVNLNINGDNSGIYSIYNQYSVSSDPSQITLQNKSNVLQVGSVSIKTTVSIFLDPTWPDYQVLVPLDHRGVRVGEEVANTPSPSLYVLSFGVTVIGSWVSLILVEQAVALRVRSTTMGVIAWLALSSLAAAIGLWSSALIGITAIRLPDLPDGYTAITFDSVPSFTSILVAWPIMLITFLAVIRGVHSRAAAKLTMNTHTMGHDGSTNGSATGTGGATQPQNKSVADSVTPSGDTVSIGPDGKLKQKQTKCSQLCAKITDRWLVVGTIVLLGCIVATDSFIFSGLLLSCDISINAGIVIAGVCWAGVFGYLSLFLFFHFRATQVRFIGAFTMGAAMFGFHSIAVAALTFNYNEMIPESAIDASVLQLVGAIVTAGISFILIGLNVTRLKLSRDVLDAYLLQTQKKVRRLESQIHSLHDQLDEQSMLFTLIHVMRPITRRAHFLLTAMMGTADARDALYGPTTSPPQVGTTHGAAATTANPGPTTLSPVTSAGTPGAAGNDTTVTIGTTASGTPTAAAATAAAASASFAIEAKNITMQSIMENVATLEIFKDAVYVNHNSENLSFILDVTQYQRIDIDSERRLAALDICATFLADAAPHQLNISGPMRITTLKKIHDTRDAPSRKVFEGAEAEARRLLMTNDWPRFVGSEAYDACVMILKATRYFKARKQAASQQRDSTGDDHGTGSGGGGNMTGSGASGAVSRFDGGSGGGQSNGFGGAPGMGLSALDAVSRRYVHDDVSDVVTIDAPGPRAIALTPLHSTGAGATTTSTTATSGSSTPTHTLIHRNSGATVTTTGGVPSSHATIVQHASLPGTIDTAPNGTGSVGPSTPVNRTALNVIHSGTPKSQLHMTAPSPVNGVSSHATTTTTMMDRQRSSVTAAATPSITTPNLATAGSGNGSGMIVARGASVSPAAMTLPPPSL